MRKEKYITGTYCVLQTRGKSLLAFSGRRGGGVFDKEESRTK
jgi:hypothetical protein